LTAAGSGYRAVLLDALGTLLALESPWPLLRRTLEARHGIQVSEGEAREAMLAEMAYYREHHCEGADAASLAELRRRCARVLAERLPAVAVLAEEELVDAMLDSLRFEPYLDAAPALAVLRAAGLRLAVVSNWDCSLASVLSEVGLGGAFDAVVVSAEAGAKKPEREIFELALSRLRCEPGESLFVGDSLETDVRGASAAGLRAVLIDRAGATSDSDVEWIHSLSELGELLGTRPA
jgi:putative hydrolase of the HAD superfamily